MARDLRHAARPHAGAREAGRGAGAAGAAAPACGAAADRPRLGDAAAARIRRVGRVRPHPRPARPRGRRRPRRRPWRAGPAHAPPLRRRGDARRAGGGPRARRRRPVRRAAAGGSLDGRARRRRGARDVRPGPGRRVPRGGHARGADPRRVPRALPRPLDPGERVVGVVRPRREPVLGRARPAPVGRLHHAQRDGRAGGRRRLVAGRRALRQGRVLRLRAPGARGLRRRRARARRRALGRRARRVPARLGRRDWRAPTRTRPAWPSRARPSRTPARSATGIRRCRRAPRASLRRSSSRVPRRRRP